MAVFLFFKFIFLYLSFRYPSCLAAGLVMVENETGAGAHGTRAREGAWFPPFLVCEFERGMKS